MKLEVKKLVLAPMGETEDLSVEMFNEQFEEDVLAERIKGNLHLTKLEEEILAQFSGSAKLLVRCDRCAEDFTLEIPLKFSQEYLLYDKDAEIDTLEVSRDFYIDFREPVRQEVLSAIPIKKICKSDCAGLCVNCGANLNAEKCRCFKNKKTPNDKSGK